MEKITHNIKEDVLSLIKKGDTVMRPRWHFVLKTILLVASLVALIIIVPYLLSFIIFILFRTGILFAPVFGFAGVRVLLFSLPWILIVLSVASLIGLETVLKRYPFTYKKPLVYSLFMICAIAIAGGFFFSRFGLHERLYRLVEDNQPPVAKSLFHGFSGQIADPVTSGVITTLSENQFLLLANNGETYTVIINKETQLPQREPLWEGDDVLVLGEKNKNLIEAIGIKKFPKNKNGSFFQPEFPRSRGQRPPVE